MIRAGDVEFASTEPSALALETRTVALLSLVKDLLGGK